MDIWGIILIISILVLVVGVGLYFFQKWAGKKSAQQNDMVAQHKQTATIYVIDKKKDKITNANLPKAMTDQVPRLGRMMKMPLVKAKIGPQIMTFICDAEAFKVLPVKKTVTVEIAGAYIVGMKGMKTKMELAEQRKSRRKGAKDEPDAPPKRFGKIRAWHDNLHSKFKR